MAASISASVPWNGTRERVTSDDDPGSPGVVARAD